LEHLDGLLIRFKILITMDRLSPGEREGSHDPSSPTWCFGSTSIPRAFTYPLKGKCSSKNLSRFPALLTPFLLSKSQAVVGSHSENATSKSHSLISAFKLRKIDYKNKK
jgi:hypothetical protein